MKKLTKNLVLPVLVLMLVAIAVFCVPSYNRAFADTAEGTARAEILLDFGTGQVLNEKDSHTHLPIASVTKLTTLLLAFEAIDRGEMTLDQKLVASKTAAGMGGSQVFIDAGAEYEVANLLHAIIISSANDASVMIAENLAGSEQNFVEMMNERVRELGGNDTNYGNCTGLPCATAYSCAFDVALVMRQVLTHPIYYEISGIWMENFAHPSGRVTQMANTNKLLRSYGGCDAGKTGSTSEAGFCLSASAKRGDLRLIAVVLGAENSKARFGECAKLLDYGFDNFTTQCVLSKDSNIDGLALDVRNVKNVPLIRAERDYFTLNKRGEEKTLDVAYEVYAITAPLMAGDVVGKAIITNDGVVVSEINLILANDVEAKTVWDNFRTIAGNW